MPFYLVVEKHPDARFTNEDGSIPVAFHIIADHDELDGALAEVAARNLEAADAEPIEHFIVEAKFAQVTIDAEV